MIRTQVYIPDDLYYQAKLQAQQDKQSMSVILRDGLRLGLNKRIGIRSKKKISLMKAMGSLHFSNKQTNIALTHDDIYDL